jgi:hypothetical protein
MNYQPLTTIVQSSDGVDFAVATDSVAVGYERAFARTRSADELARHGDFIRVDHAAAFTEAPAPQDTTPTEHPHTCDPSREALCRALARWHTAAVVDGKGGRYPDGDERCRAWARWYTGAVGYPDGDEPEELQ